MRNLGTVRGDGRGRPRRNPSCLVSCPNLPVHAGLSPQRMRRISRCYSRAVCLSLFWGEGLAPVRSDRFTSCGSRGCPDSLFRRSKNIFITIKGSKHDDWSPPRSRRHRTVSGNTTAVTGSVGQVDDYRVAPGCGFRHDALLTLARKNEQRCVGCSTTSKFASRAMAPPSHSTWPTPSFKPPAGSMNLFSLTGQIARGCGEEIVALRIKCPFC